MDAGQDRISSFGKSPEGVNLVIVDSLANQLCGSVGIPHFGGLVEGMLFNGGLAGVNLHVRKLAPGHPRRLHAVKCITESLPFGQSETQPA